MRPNRILSAAVFVAALLASGLVCADPQITADGIPQGRLNLQRTAIVRAGTDTWNVTLAVQLDNNDPVNVPTSFRRWWHAQIQNIDTTKSHTFHVRLIDAEYRDVILPVWSFNESDEYSRCPLSALPVSNLDKSISFTLSVPPGTQSFRIAKYFPYSFRQFEKLREKVLSQNGKVRESVAGLSSFGKPIYLWEFTDMSTPSTGKRRAFIHTAHHPSENTAYFMMEGFVDWLLSGTTQANTLLQNAIIDIVPIANPDGLAFGNYRVSGRSLNLEVQFAAPYDSNNPETRVLLNLLDNFMGTYSQPGQNPVEIFLNLHSTHEVDYPFHFEHKPYYLVNGTGVIPIVTELEELWIDIFKSRNAMVQKGVTEYSELSTRQYPESMIHDRWSASSRWTGPPVMAITIEGTYHYGATGCCSSVEDYKVMGQDMGLSILDYFSLVRPKQPNTFLSRKDTKESVHEPVDIRI